MQKFDNYALSVFLTLALIPFWSKHFAKLWNRKFAFLIIKSTLSGTAEDIWISEVHFKTNIHIITRSSKILGIEYSTEKVGIRNVASLKTKVD